MLRLGVHGARVLRIGAALKAVTAGGHEPVGVGDAVLGPRPRRAAEGEVVLRAAIHVIERQRVVDVELVELSDRQIGEELVALAAVEALVQPAVAADEQVIAVVRIDPDDVIVDVLVPLA